VADASDRAVLTAKLEQAQQRIAELEYEVAKMHRALTLIVMCCDGTSDDDANPAPLVARTIDQLQARIAEQEERISLLRGADETAESLAADLTRATQRVAELESRRCENCAAWSTISHPEFGDERWCAHNGLYTSPDYTCGDFKRSTDGK
jgi:hypothetical protein